MKKVISILLVVTMCCGLMLGCAGKPKEVSQEVYDLGVETCDVLDDFIQGKMSQDTASDKLDELAEKAEKIEENIKKSRETTVYEDGILIDIKFAFMDVDDIYVEEGETYKAEDKLETLKESLNLK